MTCPSWRRYYMLLYLICSVFLQPWTPFIFHIALFGFDDSSSLFWWLLRNSLVPESNIFCWAILDYDRYMSFCAYRSEVQDSVNMCDLGACLVIFRTQCWNMLTIILVDADYNIGRRWWGFNDLSILAALLYATILDLLGLFATLDSFYLSYCTFWLWWFELPLLMTIEEFARSGIKYLLLSRLVWFYDDWTHQLSMVSWMCALGFDVWLFFPALNMLC